MIVSSDDNKDFFAITLFDQAGNPLKTGVARTTLEKLESLVNKDVEMPWIYQFMDHLDGEVTTMIIVPGQTSLSAIQVIDIESD